MRGPTLADDSLFYLPQHRDALLDRITNAYFRRGQPNFAEVSFNADDPKADGSSLELPGSNAGLRLYRNAMRLHQRKQTQLNESMSKVVDDELLECSFQPGLNISASLLDTNKRDRERVGTFNLLYEQSKKPNHKVESLKVLRDSRELEELRQKPEINSM